MLSIAGRLAGEVSKFLTVGAIATVVAFVIFNGLVHGGSAPLNDRPQLGYFLANCVGMMISFRGTRDWALKHRDVRHPDGGRTAFLVINLVTMLIPMACLWISRNVLGLDDPLSDNIAANVIGLGMGTVVRFLLFRQYVFPREGLEAARNGAEATPVPDTDPSGV